MSRKPSNRDCLSPESSYKPIFPKQGSFNTTRHNRKRVVVGILNLRLPKSSPVRLLRRIGSSVMRALRSVSRERNSSSRKVLSSSSSYLVRSSSVAESESHRAEAIEDCIEFLNSSSSSFSRSNSVSTCSC